MNMYIFCKITKKIWFGGFNANNYEETIISFFFPLMHTGPVIFIQNIINVALNNVLFTLNHTTLLSVFMNILIRN